MFSVVLPLLAAVPRPSLREKLSVASEGAVASSRKPGQTLGGTPSGFDFGTATAKCAKCGWLEVQLVLRDVAMAETRERNAT